MSVPYRNGWHFGKRIGFSNPTEKHYGFIISECYTSTVYGLMWGKRGIFYVSYFK